jgi:hypothetical protein
MPPYKQARGWELHIYILQIVFYKFLTFDMQKLAQTKNCTSTDTHVLEFDT